MNHIGPGKSISSILHMNILNMTVGVLMIIFIFGPLKAVKVDAAGWDSKQWEIQYPDMSATWLNDIWGLSDYNIFTVGSGMNGATIGHFDGQTWRTMDTYFLEEPWGTLTAIWGSSQSNIFAVGGTPGQISGMAMILHYNGAEWSIMDSDFPGCLLDVWGSGPNDVFATGTDGLFIHWDGNSWTEVNLGSILAAYEVDFQSIWGDGPNNVFCLCYDSQQIATLVLRCQNGQWTIMKTIPSVWLYDIWGTSAANIWAVGDHIYRYQGSTWQDVTPSDLQNQEFFLNKVVGRSANDLIAVGRVDLLDLETEEALIIRYDGQTWKKVEGIYIPGDLKSAWVGQGNKALAVGENYLYAYPQKGIILSYDGVSWKANSTECYEGTYFQVWANSSQSAFAVGGYESEYEGEYITEDLARVAIARYDGQYWTPVDVSEYGILYDIWGSPSQELFAVGGDSYTNLNGQQVVETRILNSTDGTDWNVMPGTENFADFLGGVFGTTSNDVFAVGEGIYHFNGIQWSKMQIPSTAGILNSVWASDPLNVFAVGDLMESNGKATILRYNGQSWTFMNHTIQEPLFKVFGTSASDVFALGYDRIYHYDGVNWSAMDCPVVNCYYDIFGTSPDNIFATYDIATTRQPEDGGEPLIYFQCGIVHYDGHSWTDTGFVPVYGPLFGIGGTSPNNLFLSGGLGTILHLKSGEQSSQQRIHLEQGWNLISFQVNVCFHSQQQQPSDVFLPEGVEFQYVPGMVAWLSDRTNSPIRDSGDPLEAGDWQRIISFDRKGAHFLDKSAASYANTLTYLAAGYGYWIKMNRPGYLVLNGQMLPSSASVHLQEGWNLIGPISHDSCYYQGSEPPCLLQEAPPVALVSTSGPAILAALSSIAGKFQRVTGFDCKGAKFYDIQAQSYACTLRYFAPGFGYWIKMNQEGDLTLPPSL
ncbi:MAG: hypothetical protein AB1847_10535 [bacterium]